MSLDDSNIPDLKKALAEARGELKRAAASLYELCNNFEAQIEQENIEEAEGTFAFLLSENFRADAIFPGKISGNTALDKIDTCLAKLAGKRGKYHLKMALRWAGSLLEKFIEVYGADDILTAHAHLIYARRLVAADCFVEAEKEFESCLKVYELSRDPAEALSLLYGEIAFVLEKLGKNERLKELKEFKGFEIREIHKKQNLSQNEASAASRDWQNVPANTTLIEGLKKNYEAVRLERPYGKQAQVVLKELISALDKARRHEEGMLYRCYLVQAEIKSGESKRDNPEFIYVVVGAQMAQDGNLDGASYWLNQFEQSTCQLPEPGMRITYLGLKLKCTSTNVENKHVSDILGYFLSDSFESAADADIAVAGLLSKLCVAAGRRDLSHVLNSVVHRMVSQQMFGP